jgi:peptidoglycan/LPS O-acetylase OafA/YrhL
VFVERFVIDVIEIKILGAKGDEYQMMTFPLYIVITLLLSYLATEFVETPILKIRDRLVPKRSINT